MNKKRLSPKLLFAVAIPLAILGILYMLRPLGIIHSPLLGIYRIEVIWVPALVVAALVLMLGMGARKLRKGKWLSNNSSYNSSGVATWPFSLAAFGGFATFAVCLTMVGGWRGSDIYHNAKWQNVAPNNLQTSDARLAPYDVWHNRANAQFTESGQTLENAHLTTNPRTGEFEVSFERAPRGFMNGFSKTTPGGAYMNVESTAPRLEVPASKGSFKVGVTNCCSDSLDWKTTKQDFWVSNQETVAMRKPDGEQVFVTPYIKWEGLIRRPTAGGVWVLHRDGKIDNLSPKQAARVSWLQRSGHIFSEELARRVQNSYVWKNGIINNTPFGSKQDLIKVTDVSEDTGNNTSDTPPNTQPYLMNMKNEGLVWATIASPQGRANAVAAVFLTSTINGKTWVVRAPKNVLWIDNDRAIQIVKSRPYPGVQWSAGNYRAVEPRPLFIKGRLQYLVSIIPDSGISVTRSVIVDAQDAEVVATFNHDDNRAASDAALRAYIRTGNLQVDGQIVTAGPDQKLTPQSQGKPLGDRAVIQKLIQDNERQHKILQELLARQKN